MTKSKEDELFFDFLEANPGALALYNMVLQEGQTFPPDATAEDKKNRSWMPMGPSKSPKKCGGSTVPPKSPGKPMVPPMVPKSPGKPMAPSMVPKSPGKYMVPAIVPPKSPGKTTAAMKPQSAAFGRSPKKSVSVTNVLGKSPSKSNFPIGKSPQKSYSVLNVGYNPPPGPVKKTTWGKEPEIKIPETPEQTKVYPLHGGTDSKRNTQTQPLTDVSNSLSIVGGTSQPSRTEQKVIPKPSVFATMDTITPLNDVPKQPQTGRPTALERGTSRVAIPPGQDIKGTKTQPQTSRNQPPNRNPQTSQKAENNELASREQEKKEQERKEQERKEQERKEQERKEHERKEQERKEKERKEQERKEQERKEQERKEQDRKEQERKEQDRKEQERKDQERKEQERREQERREQERREQERREQERRQQERREQDRREQDRSELDRSEQDKRQYSDSSFRSNSSSSSIPKLSRSKSDPSKSKKDVVTAVTSLTHDNILEMLEGLTEPVAIYNHAVNVAYGVDIRDRSHHLKRYKETLVGEELVSWLVGHKIAMTREKAVQIGKEICKLGLIEHVTKSHEFEDSHQFYVLTTKGKFARKEQALPYFSNIFDASNGVEIKDRNWGGMKKYKSCFVGQEFVDWFLRENQVKDRNQALRIGRAFLEADLIEHVTQDHHFKDAQLCYHLTRRGILRRMQGNTTTNARKRSRAEPPKLLPTISGDQRSDTSQHTDNSWRERTPNSDVKKFPVQTTVPTVSLNPPAPTLLTVTPVRSVQMASAQVVAMASQKMHVPKPDRPGQYESSMVQDYSLSDDSDIDAASNISVLEREEDVVRSTVSHVGGGGAKGRANGKTSLPPSTPVVVVVPSTGVGEEFSLETHLGDPSGVRFFRQYLIKACRFQEADSVDFLTEIFHLKSSPKNQVGICRQIFQTYICDSSTNFIPLPKSLTNAIHTHLNEKSTSPNMFDDAQEYVLGSLRTLVQDYCKSPQYSKWMVEKGMECAPAAEKTSNAPEIISKSSEPSPNDSFLENLDFCYAVSTFKVNFVSKNVQERQVEAEQIAGKYFGLNGSRRLINVLNTTPIDEVVKLIKSGTIKVDLFDKTLADVAAVLNSVPSKTISSTAPPPDSNSTPPLPSVPSSIGSVPRLSGPSQETGEPAKSSASIPPVSTPSIHVTSVPMTSVPVTSVPVTSVPVTSVPVTSVPVTSVTMASSASSAPKFSIVVRRFNKRGGIRIILPDTFQELLATAGEKLKVIGVKIREPETEAEIPDLSFLKPDMVVWLMTSEEEEQFC